MYNLFANLKENHSLQKRIELEAKETERKYLENHFNTKIEDIRLAHAATSLKSQETYENILRTQEKTQKDLHRLAIQDINETHKKEIQDLKQKINELKKDNQEQIVINEKALKSKTEESEKEKSEIVNKYEEDISKMKEIFVQEARNLKARVDELSGKLRDAQRGYFIYLKYAVLSFHYIKELRAESEAWVQHSITYKQRMESMHSKFKTIDKFNEKTEPMIREMLHYNSETDEDIIDAVVKEFEKLDTTKEIIIEENNIKEK